MRRALDAAGLGIALDRTVGDGGDELSAGERRRLAMARALLRGADLVVLDEATAGSRRGQRGIDHPGGAGRGRSRCSRADGGAPAGSARRRRSGGGADMNELVRILRLGRSGRGRLALSVCAGVGATGAAVALAGVSAWLIARAAERPPVLYLMVAIVAVRAFGLSRGVLRYLERLAGHDAAFRVLGDVRATVVDRLARLLPGGARGLSRGEMSARFVGDVDGLLDLWVRVLLPGTVAAVVAVASVVAMALILPVAGVVLAATLVLAGVVTPAIASRWSAAAQRTIAPDRGEYQRRVLEVLDGAAELTVLGRLEEHLDELDHLDRSLRRAEARTSFAAGVGSALAVVAAGAAVIGSLWFGAAAIGRGDLGGPAFAVIVLMPFAVHEAVGALAPVAAALPGLRVSARRVCEVLDAPDPVVEPATSADLPDGPIGLEIRGLRAGWPGGPTVLDGVDLVVEAGSTVAIVGPSGAGQEHARRRDGALHRPVGRHDRRHGRRSVGRHPHRRR